MDGLGNTFAFIASRTVWKYRSMLTGVIRQDGYDITPEHWIVLICLFNRQSASQIDLARATYKDKANVTRLLRRLLDEKLIKRERSSKDRRFFEVSLTKEGRALVKALRPKLRKAVETVNRHFGEDRMEFLKQELPSLTDSVDAAMSELGLGKRNQARSDGK